MKRGVIFLIFITILFGFSCSSKDKKEKSGDNKVEVKAIDVKSAASVMDNYIRYVVENNKSSMKSFYSKALKETSNENKGNQGTAVVGYKIDEMENKENEVECKVHIYSEYKGEAYFSDDTYKYTLIDESGKVVIDKIQKQQSMEIYEKNNILYKREDDSIKGTPIITIGDLPFFTNITRGNTMESKIYVPRNFFGPCAQSPDGSITIISSGGKGFLIAALKESEEKETFKLATDKASGESDSGGGTGDSSKNKETEEKKPTITFKPIDFYNDETVNIIAFSEDGKTLVVETRGKNNLGKIYIYKEESNDMVKQKFDNQFEDTAFSITSPYFTSPDEIVFKVDPLSNSTIEQKKFRGQWMINLKTNKIKQIR